MSNYLTDEELRKLLPAPVSPDQDDWLIAYARAAIAAYLRKHGEPVAWRYSVQPQVLGPAVWVLSEKKDVPSAQPLYTAPQPTQQERQDAAMWNWLVNDCDGNVQDDFIHWLAGNVASRTEIEAWLRAAMNKEPGHE